MSEQSVNVEGMSPKDRAVAYLEMQQHQKSFPRKDVKDVHSPHPIVDVITAKTPHKEPITDTVTAYEEMIDKFGEKGYVDLAQKMEKFRPDAYKGLRAFQWTAKAADIIFTAALIFDPGWIRAMPGRLVAAGRLNPAHRPFLVSNRLATSLTTDTGRILGTIGMWRFRPLEWVGGKMAKLGAKVLTSDAVAPIVNNILGGGERVEKKPLPFSGTKPARA